MPFGNRTHSSTRTGPFEDRDIGADGATGTARAGKAARPTAIPASRVVFAACRRALRPPRHPISLPRSHRDHSHTHRGASMSLRRTVAAAALAAVTLTLASRAGASPWVLKPGEFYSELTGSLFSANTFFDDNRERPPLNGKMDERELTSFT